MQLFTWYNDAVLENAIQEGAMLNTPVLTSNATYYVTQTVDGCESDATTVLISVITPASAPILTADPTEICTGQTSELTSSAGANTVWYSDAGITQVGTGATFTTPEILSTTTFYARDETNSNCPSLFGSVTINVTENVDAPIVQGTSICSGTSVILTGGNSNTVWYDNPALYIPALTTGTTYTTPILNTNTTYYLRNENGDCVSDVIEVLVTVLPTPVAPQITGNQPVCEGESITLTANCGGNEARWYNSNDELVSIGVSLVLNNPIDGASYYATCKNGDCESTASRPVTIEVYEKPQLVDYLGQFFYPACPGEETEAYFDVSNLSDDEVVYVYSDINMTDASYIDFADNIFDFAVIDDYLLYQSRTFYYEVVNLETGCNSEVGSFFIEVVQPTQVVTAEADPTCVGEPVTVRIANYDFIGNVVIYDYDGRNVGEATINDISGVTEVEIPALGNSGYYNYYIIEYGDIFCTSIPATFIVNVLPAAADVTTINDTICVGEVATLTATSNDPITWYSDATLLNAVGTGNTLVIPGLTTTKNYYAVSSNGTCKSSSEMATVVVNPLPAKPVVNSNSPVCEGASINLTTTATGNVTYNWTGPNGYTSNVQNPQIASAVKATHQGIYTLTITDNVTGCTSMSSSVQVDINPGIQAPTASNNGSL
ncbi:MAG: hypothetical protein IPK18_02540 [Sphingobacteriales bacterium]|nr:MAG: hypothetical protein IPK18_02540 [Sphingobacteriales bacterium]